MRKVMMKARDLLLARQKVANPASSIRDGLKHNENGIKCIKNMGGVFVYSFFCRIYQKFKIFRTVVKSLTTCLKLC